MSKGKIEIIETCCRSCSKTIRTLSHSIIGADAAREKFGSICGDYITPEEDNELTEMLLAGCGRLAHERSDVAMTAFHTFDGLRWRNATE